MKTKDKITNKALELFNEFGTNAVSTNHIAKALEMSPGNLYYHFKNKEEIIQELLKKMIEEYKGEISVKTEEGRGTKFTIVLPTNLES